MAIASGNPVFYALLGNNLIFHCLSLFFTTVIYLTPTFFLTLKSTNSPLFKDNKHIMCSINHHRDLQLPLGLKPKNL